MHYTLKESDKDKAEGANGAGALQQKLLESRSIVISGEINQELAQKVITQMILLQSVSNDPIKLYINSQGGHVEAGDTIHDFIKFIRPDVHIIGAGWVASAGITIFPGGEKRTPLLAAKYPRSTSRWAACVVRRRILKSKRVRSSVCWIA
jgi:ATP-dependent Clp protease protease subunit